QHSIRTRTSMNLAEAKRPFRSLKCRRWLWAICGAIVIMAAVVWLVPSYEGPAAAPAFDVVVVKEVKQVATNVVVFRVISRSEKEFVLPYPGWIRVPSAFSLSYYSTLWRWRAVTTRAAS